MGIFKSKIGLASGSSLLLPWAVFLDASEQLRSAINYFKHDNIFGATAFGSYS